jgi:hypothetical protein
MQAVAQRLKASGIPIYEFPQSVPNLTAMGSCLFDLIKSHLLLVHCTNHDAWYRVDIMLADAGIHPLASGLPASSENAYHPRQFRVHLGNPGSVDHEEARS